MPQPNNVNVVARCPLTPIEKSLQICTDFILNSTDRIKIERKNAVLAAENVRL